MNLLKKIFTNPTQKNSVEQDYLRIVEQARAPKLYTEFGIPDTFDGRFESIVLHLFIEAQRVKRSGDNAAEQIRELEEYFFADMDRNFREMGIGDTGVGKRVKTMASALLGRFEAYEDALDDTTKLADALRRNVYATAKGDIAEDALQHLMLYVKNACADGKSLTTEFASIE